MKRVALALALLATAAHAEDAKPLNLNDFDPAEVKAFLGAYVIKDEMGTRTCVVKLSRKETIGGMVIKVAPGCAKTFPVMADVASWRLYEGWEIVLADATRKGLIRFYTPDNEYVSDQPVDGIATIVKK